MFLELCFLYITRMYLKKKNYFMILDQIESTNFHLIVNCIWILSVFSLNILNTIKMSPILPLQHLSTTANISFYTFVVVLFLSLLYYILYITPLCHYNNNILYSGTHMSSCKTERIYVSDELLFCQSNIKFLVCVMYVQCVYIRSSWKSPGSDFYCIPSGLLYGSRKKLSFILFVEVFIRLDDVIDFHTFRRPDYNL